MNDEQIMQRGGAESDIEAYANQNGANLTKYDIEMETKISEQQFMTRRNSELIVVNDEPMLAYNGLKLDEQVEASMLVAYNHAQQTLHHQLQKVQDEALAREKQLKQVHMMELDAISCMSLEQYVAWRDHRKQRPNHSELDQEVKCRHDVVAKYCFRCKRPDLAGTPPDTK